MSDKLPEPNHDINEAGTEADELSTRPGGVITAADPPNDEPALGGDSVPLRVCRKCSRQSRAAGEFCPFCGARFSRRSLGARGKALVASLLVLLLAAGPATAIPRSSTTTRSRPRSRPEAPQSAAVAKGCRCCRRRCRQTAGCPTGQEGWAETAGRAAQVLVSALEKSVTKDAQKDVDSGLLSGPAIIRTQCTPVGGGNLQDTLADHTGDWPAWPSTNSTPMAPRAGTALARPSTTTPASTPGGLEMADFHAAAHQGSTRGDSATAPTMRVCPWQISGEDVVCPASRRKGTGPEGRTRHPRKR